MSSVQIGQILEPKAPLARELVLSQNVCRVIRRRTHPFTHFNPMQQGVNPV
jgi:hypothetical protein